MAQGEGKDIVQLGDYVVIQRQKYTKLQKVNQKATAVLGRDQVELGGIIGKPVWATYRMVPKKNAKRTFVLEESDTAESLAEKLKKDISSGVDNRNIFDDGSSQQLSRDDIVGLRDSGMSGHEIVGQLVEKSKTFRDKTEYAQEKYLKKKEKKYFEYVTIRRPTIRLIADILYRQDSVKILGLRMDTLSQLVLAAGMHSDGTYILYESGCQGLVASAMLNFISGGGRVIHIHPGNIPQKQAILAMNYSETQMQRLISVNMFSLLRKLKVINIDTYTTQSVVSSFTSENTCEGQVKSTEANENEDISDANYISEVEGKRRRSASDDEEKSNKKPRWELETEKAAVILSENKADALIVVGREHPANIFMTLLPFVAPSRPFAVYCVYREPLQDLYIQLKTAGKCVALRLTESWLRSHQVLPSRTHPDILTSGSGGYLLSGTVVD